MAQIAIRMPKMSMTMTEGEVSEWFVRPGDTVSEGDVICEVLTDKVDMEVESPASGTISSIEVESGSVDVGTPIGYIEGDDSGGLGDLLSSIGDAASVPDTATQQEPADAGSTPLASEQASEPPTSERGSDPVAAVPRARGLATDHGIDLASVSGTGPDGLILVADVQAMLPETRIPSVAEAARGSRAQESDTTPRRAASQAAGKRGAQIRARVAAKMIASASVPQFTVWRDLDLDVANSRRNTVSWTTVLLGAYAAALRQVPELLQRWDGSAAVDSGPPSIGLAIDTPHGLIAPVLSSPDVEDPGDLDRRVRNLVSAAHSGRVDAAYLQAANATLSNLGGLGIDRFQALVTPPQATVLSVGSVKQRPVGVPGGLGLALTVTVGLTVDHRVADGASGARLLAALDRAISQWSGGTWST